MITGEIKNKVDAIWEIYWTGGVTNSISVLEQMTYMFFMKMLDDKQTLDEANANLLKYELKDPFFPKGEWTNPETGQKVPYEEMRWHVFREKNSVEMFNMIRTNVFVFMKNIPGYEESAYSRYLKDAVFLITDANKLQKIVNGIDSLDMNNTDTMGDVYEYILGKMAASGTNGQFRTPRHIIEMIVNIAKPTINDMVCDPAMGSAGFLMGGMKYISEHNKKEIVSKESQSKLNSTTFTGYDTDATMLRIGAMNMMLHGVKTPNIKQMDSLSEDNEDKARYSVIMANPPFAGSLDKQTISKDLLSLTDTSKTELLFLSLFLRILKIGGRCVSIVPDGILFGSSKAHKAIRKEIVDNQYLRAVISMPSGVFQPYSGVSTAILVFTKTDCGGTDNVWFYDMKADGYTLDQKRDECQENDIPDILERWNNLEAEAERMRTDKSFMVPVDEIRENDYELSINKYKEIVREKVEYEDPKVVLGRIKTLVGEINEELTKFEEGL